MADSTFLRSLLSEFNGAWTRAFQNPVKSREAGKALDAAITAQGLVSVPIGAIIWWHKSDADTPALPANFAECNGQVLNDPESVYDGNTLPDINVDGRFIRGSAISGTEQAQDVLMPAHTHTIAHTHDITHGHTLDVENGAGIASAVATEAAHTLDAAANRVNDFSGSSGAASAANSGSTGSGTETRPINISMVAIMRVK